jgi:ferritin-like metal-binding protein YciE
MRRSDTYDASGLSEAWDESNIPGLPAIEGIIEEAEDVACEVADKDALDAASITAAQAFEHYEITRYGSLIAWAKRLGHNNGAGVLEQT